MCYFSKSCIEVQKPPEVNRATRQRVEKGLSVNRNTETLWLTLPPFIWLATADRAYNKHATNEATAQTIQFQRKCVWYVRQNICAVFCCDTLVRMKSTYMIFEKKKRTEK